MSRLFNFSAGPAALPTPVLERAQAEMLDWQNLGCSVMELSHRGKPFMALAQKAEADLRELMSIPDNYSVLFLQGGASSQFASVPLNLMGQKQAADYYYTGTWSRKAIAEAKRYGEINIVGDMSANNFTTLPDEGSVPVSDNAAFVHYTPNETIHGLEFSYVPETGGAPLVADMSSNILSQPIDVSKFGIIYAGAQKNIGPAGLTIAIVREDLIGHALPQTPAMLNYQSQADNDSMYNTPPTYSWYLAGLVFEWLKEQGGLSVMADINQRKAKLLYSAIDKSGFYANPVNSAYRSIMNVPFTLADTALDALFLEQSHAAGLLALKGHKEVGGIRASIYNAMPYEGVEALVDFMAEFERTHG
jgi:phosphoserine aminotransferase